VDVENRNAAIVGAGLIGRAWAVVFARAGWHVRLFDAVPKQLATARELIAQSLVDQEAAGLLADARGALARITSCTSLNQALTDAVWVQENLPEEVELKRTTFAELDRLSSPDAILASSTSAIVSSQFTANLPGRARCLVAHPVNPPHLVPVVELCGSPLTSEATRARDDGIARASAGTCTARDRRLCVEPPARRIADRSNAARRRRHHFAG
jgi:3-hydroxyacyl-CoA dehydrogenase